MSIEDENQTDKESPKIKNFEATVYSVGNSHVITVPAYNIKAGIVKRGSKYRVSMTESCESTKEAKEDG